MRFGVEGFEGLRLGLRGPGCFFFFVVAPFCSCPASLVSRIFFAVGPGCAKCFFFCCAPLGAATFRRGQSKKKNTTQGVFFFCSGPGERQGKEKLGGVFFFALAPCRRPTGLLLPLPFPGAGAKKKNTWVVFFLLWPRAGAQRGFSFPCLSPGPQQKKKHLGWCVFFLLWPRAGTGLLLPLPFPGAGAKKKTPWVVFFFLLRPCADAHSLTAGLGGDASPWPGWCLFFLLRGGAGPGWCFFFLLWPRPDAHSLWAGAISARPGWCFFFLLRPRRDFLDNNKKCLGYYIGSKKTRRGHSKKKHTTSGFGLVAALILLEGSGDLVTR